MDPTEQEFGILHSIDSELKKLASPNVDFHETVMNLAIEYRQTDQFKPNLFQMERMARLIGMSEELSDETMQHFYLGELMAFKVMQQLNPNNHHVNYQALSAVHIYARKIVEGQTKDSGFNATKFNKLVGFEINKLIESDFCFQGVSLEEQEMLAQIYTGGSDDVSQKDEHYFDFTRGYRLARMAETWYKAQLHIEVLEDQELQAEIDAYNQSNAIETPADLDDDEINSEFNGIMTASNFELSYMDILQPCDDEITTLSDKLTQHIAELNYPDIFDPAIIEDIQAKLTDMVTNDFINLETLTFQDDVTLTGNMAAIIHNTDENMVYIYPIHKSSTVRGSIVGIEVTQTPKQAWIDKALQTAGTKLYEKDIDQYGLALEINVSEISNSDGSITKLHDSEKFYLAVEYNGVQIVRDPYSQVDH